MIEVYQPVLYGQASVEQIRYNPLWFVNLSNGVTTYHKEGQRSWLELKQWLIENPDVFIKDLYFRFRDNVIHIASDSEAFFFSHGAQAWYGQPTQFFFIGGSLQDNIIKRKKFIVPELIFNEEDVFKIDDPNIQRGLIIKNDKRKNSNI